MQPWDRDQIHRLFDDLEFRVLRDRLFETLASSDPEVEEGFDVRGGALEPGTLAAWLTSTASATGSDWPWWAPTWHSTPTPPPLRSCPPTARASTSTRPP